MQIYLCILRLAREVGTGRTTIASANRVGESYSSDLWRTFVALCVVSVSVVGCLCLRISRRDDDRAYRSLCAQGLSFDNVIDHVVIPVADDDGQMVVQPWPILKPHRLATWL